MIAITLDTIEPRELLAHEMDVWVRLSCERGPSGWPEVEVIGEPESVRAFVRDNWGEDTLQDALDLGWFTEVPSHVQSNAGPVEVTPGPWRGNLP